MTFLEIRFIGYNLPLQHAMFNAAIYLRFKLLEIQRRAYQRFLLRPGYLVKHLDTLASSKALKNGGKFLKALFSK